MAGGGDYSRKAIILNISVKGGRLFGGRRLIEGRLLFEEIRYHAIKETLLLETPDHYGHLAITDNSLLWTPPYCGHLTIYITDTYGHPAIMDNSLLRTPWY